MFEPASIIEDIVAVYLKAFIISATAQAKVATGRRLVKGSHVQRHESLGQPEIDPCYGYSPWEVLMPRSNDAITWLQNLTRAYGKRNVRKG